MSKIVKFADDTKLIGKVKSRIDIQKLKDDLSKVFKWSEDWQMLFNVEKCKIRLIGKNNLCVKYFIGRKKISDS